MSFKLTDEEKNLFIQNGFDMDRVGNWIDMQYFDGKSEAEVDFELREMIDSLKGVTPTSASDAENISKWQQKGTIGAYEFAKMNTFVDKDGVEKWQPKNTDVDKNVQPVGNNKYADTPFEKFGNAWKNAGEKAKLDKMFKPVGELANKADRFAANAAKNWTYRQILAGQHDVTGRDGKIGFWEAMGKNYSTATVLPFVGGYLEGAQKEWITEIAEKIDNDTPLTWQEELIYETLVNKVKEERTRGYSIMGGIGDSLLPSLIRFGGEMALAGGVLKGVGLMNKAAKAGGIRGKFVEGLKDMGKLGAAGVVLNPSEIYSAYQARDFENKMRLTPEGEMLFAQSQEAPATTLVKSLADVALSFACEGSGKSLSALGQGGRKVGGYVVAKLSDPVNQYLAKNKNLRNVIETVYPKILDMAQKAKKIGDGVNAKTAFLADKVRFDGFLEEIGEEKLEDFLSTALGLQKENPTFDDLLQSLGGSPDEWAILCGTVALQGGALSLTSRVLQKHLGNVGMTDAEIEEVVNTLSETEKKSLVKNMLDKGIIDANTAEKIQSSEFWEDAKQKLHKEFLAQGSDEQKAKLAAELFSFMGAFKAEYGGVSDEEAFAELGTVKTEEYRNKEISDAVAERARTKREFAENFKNANYLADFLDAENISQSEYENLSDEEKRDFAIAKAMEIYDAEHQGLENERLPQDNEQTVLTGRVEYNEEQENQAPQKPLTEAQVDNLARELAEFDESGETIGAFLSVLEDDINTDNVEILKNAIQGISSGADLIDFINSKTQNKVYNQSAMKRSEFNNFDNFYNDVINNKNKNTDKKQFNAPTADGLNIRVPHDTVLHSEKEHTLTSNEWKDLLSNIDNIESAVKSHQKPRYSGIPVLLKIKTNNGCYGVVLEIFKKNNPIITTAFTDVESEIDNWIKVEAIPNGTETTFSDTRLNNIITHYAPNFKPKTYNETLYQSAVTAGAETSAEISDAQKEWQEKGTDSKYFKKWFGDSKVVDKNGQPLVAYHGTESNEAFSVFETNSPDGTPAIYFSSNKKVANSYSGNLPIYEVYLKMENPLEVDAQGKEYNDFAAEMRSNIDYASRNGYDGVIVKNIRDDWSQEKGGKVATTYVVFSPEQIKSVDNQGTFDESNPNIYYQPAYHGSPAKFDKFDHDYIGSGEGAQVHGYGTYVAESKHIADERYRERLVENKSAIEVGGDVYYANDNGSWSSQDGEEYWDSDTYYGYVLDVFNRTEDKEKSIKWLQDDLDEVLADKQEFVEENGLDGKLLEINSDNGFVNDGGEEYFDTIDEYLQRELRDYDDRISTYMRAVEVLKENDIKMYQGQLYEVEIPEDEEMLDEDLPFSEQPQKVQEAFGEVIKADQNGQLILLDSDRDESETPITSLSVGEIVSKNPNGKKIYDRISSTIADVYGVDYAEADKLASELLNRYGIKGIKYDGQIDGQCYVIFNPENIDITRTFYQEGISPKTSQKAKEVVNALKKIADGSEEETVKDLRNDLEQYGGTNDVTFVFGNDKKGIKHIAQKHGAKTLLKVFDTVVDGKVLRYVPNKKTVVLSKSDYEAVLSLDENGNKKTWLLSGWNTKEKSSGVSREVGTQSTSTQIKPTFSRQDLGAELNNSITNSDGDFNPKQSQKRTGYVFQEPAQPNLFVENAAQNHDKGFVGIDLKGNRGLTDINRNLILIGTTGDVTTVLHESAHYFLNMLEELERVPDHSPKVDDVLFAIRKTLKNDGTPFTRSQHEKFAKGFEHYIYTGNARNNIFKEIYEDIKNLLKNIYEFVQKGQYFTTGEGALTEEEMKNFNNVFDEIFKLENKTVKERVFAKVLALDEKEEEIRNKQEQELAEIWEIHNQKKEKLRQEKAASEDEKSIQDIRQDAIKYADKKENAKWKEYNEDRKNVAYSILSAATDMSVAEIKRKLHSRYKKTREDIELKLREVGDKLAASGLFEDAKVKEYFGSIDFSEVGASQQLVNMARDAIENDVNLDSPLNQDINRVLNQFEYLKKKAEKTKGHQNALILEAMFDMLSDVTNMSSMPSMFVEDLGKTVMSFAEKNEETLDRRTKRAGNKDVFRRYILKKLKDVKLYSKEDKRAVRLSTAHALYAQVATATNASTTERLLRKINNAMIEDIEMRKKSIIAKEIARQLRVNSKIITTKTRVQRGLYDWKTNSVWQALAEINKMNRSELEANLDKLLTPAARALVNVEDGMHEQNVSDKDNKAVDFSFENKLKKKFITYKLSKNLADVDSALMLDLLSDIIEFKNVARTAKSEKEQTERLQKYELKNDLAERILNAPKAVKFLIKHWFGRSRSLQNWDTFLRVCFGEDAVEKYSILDEETEKVRYEHRILAEFWSKTAAIYGKKRTWALKRWLFDPNGFADLQKLFREYESADNTWYVTETLYNRLTKEAESMTIGLNKAQIITMYAWSQNGLLHKRLINQFGEGTLNMLFGKLSEEDKKFAWLLIDTCSSLRGDINEVMTRSQGLAMVPEENYFPSIVKRQGDAIQTAGIINSRVGNPSANHLRSRSEYIAMRPISPIAIVSSHVDKMSAYVCVSEKAAFVSEIFGAPRLATAFENAFDEQMKDFEGKEKPTKEKTTDGKKLYEMLAAQLAASTYFKYTQAVKTMDDGAKKLVNNFLTQAIALKPKIALSQVLSVVNYADGNDITIMAWAKNFLHCMSHPLETIKFMKRDEFLQERFKGSLQNETMQSILTEFDKWNNVKTFFMSNTRFGDMFAIMFGGKAYINHLIKNGVSEEEAFRRFRRKTNESQQSSLPSTLSNFQRTRNANAASALMLAFTNTPTQYERKFIEGVAELCRNGGNKKKAIKNIVLYRIVSPLLFDFALQGLGLWLIVGWLGGDDDKGKIAGMSALNALMCGNCGAYGYLGIFWRLMWMAISSGVLGKYQSSRAANYSIIGDAVNEIGKLVKDVIDGEIKTEHLISSTALALSLGGVPAPAIANSVNGLVDISQGDFAIGLHEFLGWGRGVTREAFE